MKSAGAGYRGRRAPYPVQQEYTGRFSTSSGPPGHLPLQGKAFGVLSIQISRKIRIGIKQQTNVRSILEKLRCHTSRNIAHGQGGRMPPDGCEADGKRKQHRKRTLRYHPTIGLANALGKNNAATQAGSSPRARRLCRRTAAEQTENERIRCRRKLAFSCGGFSFSLCPWILFGPWKQPFRSPASCGNINIDATNKLRIPGPGAMPLVRGAGPQRPCEESRG